MEDKNKLNEVQAKAAAFKKEYEELVEKHGMMIVSYPGFKFSQDTGDYRIQVINEIIPKPLTK